MGRSLVVAAFVALLVVSLAGVASDGTCPEQVQARDAAAGPAQYPPGPLPEPAREPEVVVGIPVPAIVYEPVVSELVLNTPDELGIDHVERPHPAANRARGRGVKVEGGLGPLAGGDGPAAAGTSGSVKAPPTLTTSFNAIDYDTNASNNSNFMFVPPDPIGAAGSNHVMNVVNATVQIWNKSGGTALLNTSLSSFFASQSPTTFTFDPKVIYDQYADRFLVVTLEQTDVGSGGSSDTSKIFLAVSDDGNPIGTWYTTQINSKITIGSTPSWADYPGFAVDEEAVYITANMFGFSSSGGAFTGNRLWIVNKGVSGGFYAGSAASVSVLDPVPASYYTGTQQPAHVFDTAPTGEGTILAMYSGLSSAGQEFVQTIRVRNPLGSVSLVGLFVLVNDIDNTSVTMPNAPQLGTTQLIETNDRRSLNAVWRSNSLWVSTTVVPSSGSDTNQATAHWFQLDTSTLSSIALVQQGDVGGEDIATGTHTYFPSIAVNSAGVAAIGFSASASSIYPGSYYTHRMPTDPAGSTSGSGVLRAGSDWYYRTLGAGLNRWGDFTGTVVDPADQCFWIYNQHAISRGTPAAGEDGRWGTAFGKFCAPVASTMDFGDAPDPSYPTLMASGGAAHVVTAGYLLGSLVDTDADGQPDMTATGDDVLDGSDDEDGVVFTTALTVGGTGCVDVVAGANGGLLDAWIDFNVSGSWGDMPIEQIFTSLPLVPGPNTNLCFPIPVGSPPAVTFARFRLSSAGGLTPFGLAANGEVEDYQVVLEEALYDWGDAMDPPFPTLAASNGPSHLILSGYRMGVSVDADPDGQPDPNALGDDNDGNDDDDGVFLTVVPVVGNTGCVDVLQAGGPGFLDAWVDYDGSGVFGDSAGEQVAAALPLAVGLNPMLCAPVPTTAVPGMAFARFRMSSIGGLPPTGAAPDGEVEDYVVPVLLPTADLALTMSDLPDPVDAATTLTYTVRVDNNGPDAVNDAVVTSAIPPETVLVGTSGCAEDPVGLPTCSLGVIPSGGFVQLTIDVLVNANAMGGITASSGVSFSGSDPTPGNDTAVELTTVVAPRIAVSPATISSSQSAAAPTDHALVIGNTGTAMLGWTLDETTSKRRLVATGSSASEPRSLQLPGLTVNASPLVVETRISRAGRVVTAGPQEVAGLEVSEELVQLTEPGVARLRTVLANPGEDELAATVKLLLPVPRGAAVEASASADLEATADDAWVVWRNVEDDGPRYVGWVLCGDEEGVLRPRRLNVAADDDGDPRWAASYRVTVPTAAARSLILFRLAGDDLGATVATAESLARGSALVLDGRSVADLREVEREAVANMALRVPDCTSPVDIPWLGLSATSGSTGAGTSTTVTVTLDGAGMLAGSYGATLCVGSDDPTNPLVMVPVSLDVLADGNLQGLIDLPVRPDSSGTVVEVYAGAVLAGADVTDAAGAFQVNLAVGSYDVFAEAAEHLDSERLGEAVASGTNSLPTLTLLAGDANDNDTINIVDIAFIATHFGQVPSDPGWDPAADINDNDIVNIVDIANTAVNFGQSSPVPW